jgi:hypothetical protein
VAGMCHHREDTAGNTARSIRGHRAEESRAQLCCLTTGGVFPRDFSENRAARER